jgi:hypothetical protein
MSTTSNLALSLAWWEAATIRATVASAIVQIISWGSSLVAYRRKIRPHNNFLSRLNRGIDFERASLNFAGIAGIIALAGAFFSIGYARLADQDSLGIHTQLTSAEHQSALASDTARGAASALVQTKQQLANVTQELTGAEGELAAAKQKLKAFDKEQKWKTLIVRMNAGDADAYDNLKTFKGSSDPTESETIRLAVKAVFESYNIGPAKIHPVFMTVLTPEEAAGFLDNSVAYNRACGLERLLTLPKEPQLFPKIVQMADTDPSLDVRAAATRLVSAWTGQRFRPLGGSLQEWWDSSGRKDNLIVPDK